MIFKQVFLVFIILCLIFFLFNLVKNQLNSKVEHFTDTEFVNYDQVYDKFYSSIYDQLFYSEHRVNHEVNDLAENVIKTSSKIDLLDLGCGTGKHLRLLEPKYNVTGLDKSGEMLKIARQDNQNVRFINGDAHNFSLFPKRSFDVITCYFFTIYYFKDLNKVIKNVYDWLKPGGKFAVHIVNKDKFDPLLDLASPFPAFSLQKYSPERVTSSKIHFNNFLYTGNFVKDVNYYRFVEVFKHKHKSMIRKQEHRLFMFKVDTFLKLMKDRGFKNIGQTDLLPVGCEYQYIFYFRKK